MVPPVARVMADIAVEPPPVSPPLHPLTVIVPVALPSTLVHDNVLFGHAYTSGFRAVISPAVDTHTEPAPVLGSNMPSPVSAVTANENPMAAGSAGVVPLGGFT
jgi:hypothetical protein